MDPVALTRALVDIDSTTGQEEAVGGFLVDYLGGLGFAVTTQPVDDTRFKHKVKAGGLTGKLGPKPRPLLPNTTVTVTWTFAPL